MRIGSFHFHLMVASAGDNEEIVRRGTFPCLPATVREFTRGLPNLIID